MSISTVIAGDPIDPAWGNAIRDQGIQVFADSTARTAAISSPTEGMATYLTGTDSLEIYTTATTGWVKPWNLPWGNVGYAKVTTAQNGVGTTNTDITGLAVTFTAVANRLYVIHTQIIVTIAASATEATSLIYEGATAQNFGKAKLTTTQTGFHIMTAPLSLSAGSHTFKATAWCDTGTINLAFSAACPGVMVITDIGPSAAPA